MAYADLNPASGCMTNTPETSYCTSIKERITFCFDLARAAREQITLESLLKLDLPLQPLAKFEDSVNDSGQTGILLSLDGHLTLADFTGHCVRQGKRDATPAQLPPILERLNTGRSTWLNNATCFEKTTKRDFLGEPYTLKEQPKHH